MGELDGVVCSLYQAGLAPSTQKAYSAGKKQFLSFCDRAGLTPLPVSETKMCQFVTFLKEEGLRHQMAKSYLSAVQHLQISQDYGDPKMSSIPKLELVIRGMKRLQASLPTRPRLPITPDILWKIWDCNQEWDHIMLWAAMCLCFFGFLRSGEAVVPDTGFDPSQHLSYQDIAMDNTLQPSYVQVTINNPRQIHSESE